MDNTDTAKSESLAGSAAHRTTCKAQACSLAHLGAGVQELDATAILLLESLSTPTSPVPRSFKKGPTNYSQIQ